MNPEEEEYIPIIVNEPLLKNYFDFNGIQANKGKYSIKRKYYDQVKDLLSEYGIKDQQHIDNFCFLEMIFWGQSKWAENPDSYKESEDWKKYLKDLSKFGEFLEEYNITGIHFFGNSKATGAGSITLKDSQFIEEAMEGLSKMIWKANHFKESGIFESEKKRKGAEVKLSGIMIREHFFNLLKFLNTLPFPELNDLSVTNEDYFAGRFFSIAGIIPPKPYTTAYKNKSERYYLVKTMQSYR
jgi:hypothetical protein